MTNSLFYEQDTNLLYTHQLLQAKDFLLRLVACGLWSPSTPRLHSFLLLFAWWALCLRFWFIVNYLLPLIPLIWASYTWPGSPSGASIKEHKRPSSTQDIQANQQVLQALIELESVWESVIKHLQWSNRESSLEVFLGMLYGYIAWIAANQCMNTRYIIMALGTLAMILQSPWGKICIDSPHLKQVGRGVLKVLMISRDETVSQAQRALSFQRRIMQESPILPDADNQASNVFFLFVVYENQRYWPFARQNPWQHPMSSIERAVYSDKYTYKSLPIDAFILPEPRKMESETPIKCEKISCWEWVDNHWRLNIDGSYTDGEGWEYGTPFWTLFNKQGQYWLPTRRRRWTRLAKVNVAIKVDSALPMPTSPVKAVYKETWQEISYEEQIPV